MIFLSAPLLFGLLLASVPIIIHILNRRRFLVIDWPPMKYLKLTLKNNRRRIRIEQLILLAMRTLAIILLIFAVAQPVLSQNSLAKLLPGRARTSRILVLDDSLSMGYTTAGHTAFQSAQNAAVELIRTSGTQDSLTLLLTSTPEVPLVRNANLQDAAKLADLPTTLSLTDTPSNWAATFSAINTALVAATFSAKEVILITDLRKSGWSADVTSLASKLAADRIPLRIIDVGDRRTENTALLAFDLQDPIALPMQPIHLNARIRNNTAAALSNVQATLSVDGDSRPILLPSIPAGSTADVPLTLSLENPGTYTLSFSLPKDALPQDDSRFLTLTVRPTLNILLVDGEPSAQPFESETDFLNLAYTVGNPPWIATHVTEFDPHLYRPGSADTPDVMVLANVAALNADQVTALEKLVDNGMGLMIFTGDLVDADAYNQRLYRDGKGLLPLKLGRPSETPTAGLVVEKDPQSPLAPVAKLAPAALAAIRTRRYSDVEKTDLLPEGVSILAHWNNAENPPAILQKKFGKGHVVLFTTSAGRKWTDWPVDPTYLLSVRSTALSIARAQDDKSSLIAGEIIRVPLLPGQTALDPKVTIPNSTTPDTVEFDKSDSNSAQLRYTKTHHAGPYTLTWRNEKSQPLTRRFALSPNPAESDLDPISESDLAAIFGNLHPTIQRYDTSGIALTSPPRELWRPLAMLLLALLAAETVFAVWVGRER